MYYSAATEGVVWSLGGILHESRYQTQHVGETAAIKRTHGIDNPTHRLLAAVVLAVFPQKTRGAAVTMRSSEGSRRVLALVTQC